MYLARPEHRTEVRRLHRRSRLSLVTGWGAGVMRPYKQIRWPLVKSRSGLLDVGRCLLGGDHVLDFRELQFGGEGFVFLQVRHERGVTFVLGFAEVNDRALDVAGFGVGLGEQEIEAAAVGYRAILQQRAGAR